MKTESAELTNTLHERLEAMTRVLLDHCVHGGCLDYDGRKPCMFTGDDEGMQLSASSCNAARAAIHGVKK